MWNYILIAGGFLTLMGYYAYRQRYRLIPNIIMAKARLGSLFQREKEPQETFNLRKLVFYQPEFLKSVLVIQTPKGIYVSTTDQDQERAAESGEDPEDQDQDQERAAESGEDQESEEDPILISLSWKDLINRLLNGRNLNYSELRVELHYYGNQQDYIHVVPFPNEIHFPVYTEDMLRDGIKLDLLEIPEGVDEQRLLQYAGPMGTFYRDTTSKIKLSWLMDEQHQSLFKDRDQDIIIQDVLEEHHYHWDSEM